MPANAQIILFAIQAAVRLEGQVRQVQIDRIKRHTVELLTPKFGGIINIQSAVRWFVREGAYHLQGDASLARLVHIAERDRQSLSDAEKQQLIDAYIQLRNLSEDLVSFNGIFLPKPHIYALCQVKQWEDGRFPTPTPLQRIGGSLIEIGVDYFQTTPYLANPATPQAQLLSSFLSALDEVNLPEAHLHDIGQRMMVATLETLDQAHGQLLKGDSTAQLLLRQVTKEMLTGLQLHLAEQPASNLFQQEQAKAWGEVIFKSLLTSAGDTIIQQPSLFLGTSEGQSELIQHVGQSLLDTVMGYVDTGDGVVVSLQRLFTTDTLHAVTQASFEVVARHPEWINTHHQGLQQLLHSLVQAVAEHPRLISTDSIPSLSRQLLSLTASHLPILYPTDSSDPQQHLLLRAIQTTLHTLEAHIPQEMSSASWRNALQRDLALPILDTVLQEVIQHPEWLSPNADSVASTVLHQGLTAVLTSLQDVPLSTLNAAARYQLLHTALTTMGTSPTLLAQVTWGGASSTYLRHGLDLALSLLSDHSAKAQDQWATLGQSALTDLSQAIITRLAQSGASGDVLTQLQAYLEGEIAGLSFGAPFDFRRMLVDLQSPDTLDALLQRSMDAATRITATLIQEQSVALPHPQVRQMVDHLAELIKTYPATISAAILPDLSLQVLQLTSQQLHPLITGNAVDDPSRNLLAQASKIVLDQLLDPARWNGQAGYSPEQVMSLLSYTLQQVAQQPQWVLQLTADADPVLQATLKATLDVLAGASTDTYLSTATQLDIAKHALAAVAVERGMLDRIGVTDASALTACLDMVLAASKGQLQSPPVPLTELAQSRIQWLLSDSQRVTMLSAAVTARVAREGATQAQIERVELLIGKGLTAVAMPTSGYVFSDLIAALDGPDAIAELLAQW